LHRGRELGVHTVKAVWLAKLAKPLDNVVEAPNIALMTESVCAADWLAEEVWLQ
jgi:hypothetical protein